MERRKIGCEKTDDETVDNDDALTDVICWSFLTPIEKKNYHETILAVQNDPNFLVVFFYRSSTCTPEYTVILIV